MQGSDVRTAVDFGEGIGWPEPREEAASRIGARENGRTGDKIFLIAQFSILLFSLWLSFVEIGIVIQAKGLLGDK